MWTKSSPRRTRPSSSEPGSGHQSVSQSWIRPDVVARRMRSADQCDCARRRRTAPSHLGWSAVRPAGRRSGWWSCRPPTGSHVTAARWRRATTVERTRRRRRRPKTTRHRSDIPSFVPS